MHTCEASHKEDTMSLVTGDDAARAPAIPDRDPDHSDRDPGLPSPSGPGSGPWWNRWPTPARPSTALAAQRFARIRDQELGHGRR